MFASILEIGNSTLLYGALDMKLLAASCVFRIFRPCSKSVENDCSSHGDIERFRGITIMWNIHKTVAGSTLAGGKANTFVAKQESSVLASHEGLVHNGSGLVLDLNAVDVAVLGANQVDCLLQRREECHADAVERPLGAEELHVVAVTHHEDLLDPEGACGPHQHADVVLFSHIVHDDIETRYLRGVQSLTCGSFIVLRPRLVHAEVFQKLTSRGIDLSL
mmetsp:Transcript_6100/g.12426  ORF Transcript_6100/g.12426 Transcript_6100/m.12426 type:complete len:220 (-) Transcript_6100:376-1035(-)